MGCELDHDGSPPSFAKVGVGNGWRNVPSVRDNRWDGNENQGMPFWRQGSVSDVHEYNVVEQDADTLSCFSCLSTLLTIVDDEEGEAKGQ